MSSSASWGDVSPAAYKSLARKIAINTVVFLSVIELLGSALLNFFGISLPIVQVSGGIVIAAIGWSVLNEKDSDANDRNKREELQLGEDEQILNLEQRAFYPLAFPVTAGPGSLVVMLTLSARFSGEALSHNVLGHIGLFLAILVLSALIYVCYAYAPKLKTMIAQSTVHGILRVIAFILLCIGVQIAWNGLSVLLSAMHAH